MSRPAARAGVEKVFSQDGTGYKCKFPMTTSTGPGESKVRVEGIPVVVQGKKVAPHPKGGCTLDSSTLSKYSTKVKANGKGVGRMGDAYGSNKILSGSSKVFVG